MRKKLENNKEDKEQTTNFAGPTNLTEYLFADRNGEISDNINAAEINQIYMSYMQSLIDSYERLRTKYNQF